MYKIIYINLENIDINNFYVNNDKNKKIKDENEILVCYFEDGSL